MRTLDDLYKELFDAQLDKNWGLVAKIQREISGIERSLGSFEEAERAERESPLVEDPENVRNNEG